MQSFFFDGRKEVRPRISSRFSIIVKKYPAMSGGGMRGSPACPVFFNFVLLCGNTHAAAEAPALPKDPLSPAGRTSGKTQKAQPRRRVVLFFYGIRLLRRVQNIRQGKHKTSEKYQRAETRTGNQPRTLCPGRLSENTFPCPLSSKESTTRARSRTGSASGMADSRACV